MLIKKELKQIPVLKFPKTTVKERRNCRFAASAQLITLKKSGKILVVDVFDSETRELKLRFFCDGVLFFVCDRWPTDIWMKKKPERVIGYGEIASTKKDDDMATSFFKYKNAAWVYNRSIGSQINHFVSDLNYEKHSTAMQKKYAKRDDHFAMYPKYPADLENFCEHHVFEHNYIFIDKGINGYRNAICGHCGHEFKIESANSLPGKLSICPKCGLCAKYRGTWLVSPPPDKAKICIAHKADYQLILRWTHVERRFDGMECRYWFEDYYRNLYLHESKEEVIYSYRFFSNMGWGWNWYRKENGDVNYEKTHIYTYNLNEVFGESYYHVNLQKGLMNVGTISFPGLLDRLKNLPAAEYLFKLGLPNLAANLPVELLQEGNSFAEVLGVSAQYLALYKNFNVEVSEHRVIQASKTWISFESFEKFRALRPDTGDTNDIIELLDTMSFERFVNYFTKQKRVVKRKLQYILTQYNDYINMAQFLKVDLTRKSVQFPKNIKESHDAILQRFNEVKQEILSENFKQATVKLKDGLDGFTKGNFCIVYPELYSEFVTEGQSLNHCIASSSYFDNHVEGKKIIFFVRKITEPEKPFFTMEIDMLELRIRQLYGFGGCDPSSDVRKFANEFLSQLRPCA